MSRSYLNLLVALAGLCSLGTEMTTLTLVAPYLGTTQLVWTSIIGTTLTYLTIGYLVGGRLADRQASPSQLSLLLCFASLGICAFPVLSRPALAWASASLSIRKLAGAFAACLILMGFPVVLLGMISPYIIKLSLKEPDRLGREAGSFFAVSALGSILGTFLPGLVLTPLMGATRTFQLLALVLYLAAFRSSWTGSSRQKAATVAIAACQSVLIFIPVSNRGSTTGTVLYETQSLYNFIQVRQFKPTPREAVNQLLLNECVAIHSVYRTRFEQTGDARDLLTGSYWDYVVATPFLVPGRHPSQIQSMAIAGLGAGTTAQLFLAIFGKDCVVDGAEIDPAVVAAGRRYFGLQDNSPKFKNFHVELEDGRVFLNRLNRTYDLILIDCFRWPYIPAHLVTRECFELAHNHLTPDGVVAVKCDRGLLGRRVASTMRVVFPQVFLIKGIAVGVKHPCGNGLDNLKTNLKDIQNPALRTVIAELIKTSETATTPLQEFKPDNNQPLTDDCSPTETLVNQSILNKALPEGYK